MFAVQNRKQMRISSLPMRRKDKERLMMERRSQRGNLKNNDMNNIEKNISQGLEQEILFLQQKISNHKQELYKMEETLTIKTENYKSLINAKKMKESMDKEQLAKKKILNEVKQESLETCKKNTFKPSEPVSIKNSEEIKMDVSEPEQPAAEELASSITKVHFEEVDVDVKEVDVDAEKVDVDVKEVDVDAEEVDVDAEEVDVDAEEVAVDAEEVAVDAEEVDVDKNINYTIEEITLEEDIKDMEKPKSKRGRKKKIN